MLSDDRGTDFLPLRLIVVLLATAVLIGLASAAIADQSKKTSAALAKAGLDRLIETARAEYAAGCPDVGDGTIVLLTVPASVKSITIGGMISNGLALREEHICCLERADGSSETIYTDFPLTWETEKGFSDRPLVLYPGSYHLSIKVAESDTGLVAAIRAEAA